MGKEAKGSWRTLAGKIYLSSDDFDDGQEVTLTIEKVTEETAYDTISRQEKPLFAINFV